MKKNRRSIFFVARRQRLHPLMPEASCPFKPACSLAFSFLPCFLREQRSTPMRRSVAPSHVNAPSTRERERERERERAMKKTQRLIDDVPFLSSLSIK